MGHDGRRDERSFRSGRLDEPPLSARGTIDLLRDLADRAAGLAQDEFALLRHEMKASVRSVVIGLAALGAALLTAIAALNFLGLAAVGGLVAAEFPLWAAALIVAGGLIVLLVVALVVGITSLKSADPVPHQTIRNLRRDFRTMRASMQNGSGEHDGRR